MLCYNGRFNSQMSKMAILDTRKGNKWWDKGIKKKWLYAG